MEDYSRALNRQRVYIYEVDGSALKIAKVALLISMIVLLSAVAGRSGMAMPETIVFVDPKESSVKLGQTFPIDISIKDVSGLLGFDFLLSYDPAILELVDIQQGPFLKSFGSTFMINLTTKGLIWLAVVIYYPKEQPVSANGSGVLATATFKAIAACGSSLDLFSKDPYKPDEVKLATDPPPDDVLPIPNVAIDGYVNVSSDPSDPIDPDPPTISARAIPGDVSGDQLGIPDGKVDMRDLQYLIMLFMTKPSSSNWNPNVDINVDGVVNMRDISIALLNFNKQ